MPITADRMILIIDVAEKCLSNSENMRGLVRQLNNDIDDIRRRIRTLEIEDDHLENLLSAADASSSAGVLAQYEIDADTIRDLGYEKAHFEINKSKHVREKLRMRNKKDRDEERRIKRAEYEEHMRIWNEAGKNKPNWGIGATIKGDEDNINYENVEDVNDTLPVKKASKNVMDSL